MWFNPIIIWLLHSPIHGLISSSVMLVKYTGKKSGKTISVPVNYLSISDQLYTISLQDRIWWRNFRDQTGVNLLLCGDEIPATAQAVEDLSSVSEILVKFVRKNPEYGRFLKISTGPDGQPDAGEAENAAQGRVAVVFRVSE